MSNPATNAPPARPAARVGMSLELVIDLVLCGVLLAGLSFGAQYLQPDFPRLTFFTGLVGGGLCVLWGVWGRCSPGVRVSAMATLAVVACVLGCQAVRSWATLAGGESKGRMVAVIVTFMVVFSIGMLANLWQAGRSQRP
jgi:hypothetical protein